ncbi:hypothetical protein [Actinoplanes sp. DH11]|nr:hypothetical protein [Actinoplanes sp. DH11]
MDVPGTRVVRPAALTATAGLPGRLSRPGGADVLLDGTPGTGR